MNSRSTTTDNPTLAGVSRRDVMKGLLAGLTGAGLMPRAARGAPVQGLLSDGGSDILWDVSAPDPSTYNLYDTPAYVGGNIIFTVQNSNDFTGGLFWLDVQSQQYRGPVVFNYFLFTPVLLNGILYAAANTGGLYALDPTSGQTLWPKPAPYHIAADVVSINGQLVFPTIDGQIVALDTNGNQLWSYSTGQSVGAFQASRATFLNNAVLVAYENTLYAVDAGTGAFLWKYSATDNILGDIAVSSNGVHFSTRDQKVCGVKPDGTLGWSWPPANSPVGASLGSPVVNAEVVHVADGNGNFYAFNALDGTLAWHITLTAGASRAPIYIEDGVAYVSAGALLEDCTLYAIDLTSNGGRVISQDAGTAGTFLGVENGVAYYVHKAGQNIAASNFADQFHQFFCESQLMVEDYASSTKTNGYAGNTTSYRTHLQLLDPNYNPRACKTVKVWAADTATLTSGGRTYTIDNNGNSAMLQTDGLGELSLVVMATDLTCPALYLWGTFMDTGESLVVYPDNDALMQLSQVTGGSLQKATDYQGNPLLADSSSADALASTITNAMAGGPPQNSLQTLKSAQPQAGTPSQTRNNGHRRRPILRSGNSFMAYPGQTPNLWYFPNSTASTDRIYGTAAIPNWQATFGDNGISFLPSCDSCTGVEQLLGLSFHDLLKNVVHGAENVAKIVYQTVEKVVTVVITTAENVYNVTVTAVEHAAAVVAAAIKTAVKDIERAIQWLSYLFDWEGILATKDAIKTSLSSNFSNWKAWLTAQQADNYGGLHTGLKGLPVGSSLASPPQPLSGSMQSQQVDNNNPQDLYGMGGAKSYNQSRFLTTKVQDNAAQGQVASVSAAALGSSADDFAAAVVVFFNTVENQLTNNSSFQSLPTDVLNAFANFKNLFTDPSQFVSNSLADIAKLIKDIAGTIVALADAVIEGLIEFLLTVIDIVSDFLNTTITIPVVSDLYRIIAKSSLTILDLCALMIAIPTHIITAAMSGGPSQTQAPVLGATPTIQKLAWLVSCGLQAIFFTVADATAIGPGSPLYPVIAGINTFVVAFGFPLDFATNTDFTYIYYSVKGIPALLGWFNARVSPFGTNEFEIKTLQKATPYILCVQGMATLAMGITFAVALQKPAFIGKDYLQTVVNGLQDIPFLIKPLANGPALTPQRIAAGVIDGASFGGALGVAIYLTVEA